MTDYRVIIPDEHYTIVNFQQEGLPGVMVINDALRDFEPKVVFAWHLSIMLKCDALAENGMPTMDECKVLDAYSDELDVAFKGEEPEKPNALFLARITWNETRELIYRVFDPEPIHHYLQSVIESESPPKQFDYRIDPDEEWKLAEWHLGTLSGPPAEEI